MIAAVISLSSFCIWIYLTVAHGRFWTSRPQLPPALPAAFPAVDIIVPARDEAQTINAAIGSLLKQDYAGKFRVILVDDHSSDNTGALAGVSPNLQLIRLISKPQGWSGKLWALSQGLAVSQAEVVLLTDADIVHDPRHLSSLVAHLLQARLDLVSEMVLLNCVSLAERSLVPAFVYFFQMLYPFSKVNDAHSSVAAAAGGSILIRREALDRMGGIAAIKHALIDDVALAKAVKKTGGIFLGHSGLAASIRPYPGFVDLWRMISRTAFTQLRFSTALLALTLAGLTWVWLIPPWFIAFGHGWAFVAGLLAYAFSAVSYWPTLQRFRRSRLWVLALPVIALFFMTATLGSAVNYWRGSGATWKDRAYTG